MAHQDLSDNERNVARLRLTSFSLRSAAGDDLRCELRERMNLLARYQADLACQDFSDGEESQLTSGIVYEREHIEQLLGELERREAAKAYGYVSPTGYQGDLSLRFANARDIDCALVMQGETAQEGRRSGDHWVFTCPFHSDTTPSLTTYPPGRGWYCFQCEKGGNAIDLTIELQGIPAVDALFYLELSGYITENPG